MTREEIAINALRKIAAIGKHNTEDFHYPFDKCPRCISETTLSQLNSSLEVSNEAF